MAAMSVESNKTTAQEFQDIVVPLRENSDASLMKDEAVRRSYGSRSRSFITPQDVGSSDGQSPVSRGKHQMLSRSVSSLGESMLGVSEAVDDDDFLLSPEYLQATAYDCLLMAHADLFAQKDGVKRKITETPEFETINSLRLRLEISEASHLSSVSSIRSSLERTQGKIPVKSAIFRLCLIESLVLLRVDREATEESRLLAELRHLSVFASAMHFSIRRLQVSSVLMDSHALRLTTQLSHDVKKLRSRIVIFSRTPTADNADTMRALIAGTFVRYTQFPFAEAGGFTPEEEAGLATPKRRNSTYSPPHSSRSVSSRQSAVNGNPLHGVTLPPTSGSPGAGYVEGATSSSCSPLNVHVTDGVGCSPSSRTPEEFANDFLHGGLPRVRTNISTEDLVLTEHEVLNGGVAVLNVSSEQEDEVIISRSSPANETRSVADHGASTPMMEQATAAAGKCLGYTFPLNAMLYTTLFHTFFSPDDPKKSRHDESTAQRRKHGIHKSRRQDIRLQNVVDGLANVRTTFGITEFLHASCFIHVVFTENAEGTLNVTEMYKLLSVDCYYYPGFKQYCRVPSSVLTPDEQSCRTQVLSNIRDEFSLKLSDYHAELATSPEDLVYISKLLTTVLEFGATSGGADSILSPLSGRLGEVTGTSTAEMNAVLSPASTVPQRASPRNASSPRSGRGYSSNAPRRDPISPERTAQDWARNLKTCITEIGVAMGEDVAALAGEVLSGKCPEEVASGQLCLATYCEFVGLVIASSVKHYIRIKHKVRSSRGDTSAPTSKRDDLLDHLGGRRKSCIQRQSVSSLTADIGRTQQTGAARLAGNLLPPRPAHTVTLQRINANFRLTIDQVRHLLEVMLLEVHADTAFYTSSLIGVLPSAVPIVLAVYSKLLADDVNTTLEALHPLQTGLGSVRDSCLGFIDVGVSASSLQFPVEEHATSDTVHSMHTSRSDGDMKLKPQRPIPSGGYSSSPPNSGRAPTRHPPPPKRSSSPPVPLGPAMPGRGRSPSLEVRASHTGVPLDDVVAVSMLITNLVYTMLLLELLQANFRQYVTMQQRYPTPDTSPLGDFGSPMSDSGAGSVSSNPVDRPDLQHCRSAQMLRHRHQLDVRRPESVGSPVFRTQPPLRRADALSNAAREAGQWEQVEDGDQWSVSVGPEELCDEILYPIQGLLMRKWRSIVEATLESHVKKVVTVDDFVSVGTAQEGGISSSAVDLVSMANRITVLVSHGIENAWDALKLSRGAESSIGSPRQNSEDHMCQYFSNNCEDVISRFEEGCAAALNISFRKYSDLITMPLQELDWSVDIHDYRVLRVKHNEFFNLKSNAAATVALRANNVLFCRLRLHELHVQIISRYHLVAWKTIVGEPSVVVAEPGHAEMRASSERRASEVGVPDLQGAAVSAVSAAMAMAPAAGSASPSEASLVSFHTRQAGTILEEASSIVYKASLRSLLGFLATKLLFFDLHPLIAKMYSTDTVGMEELLPALQTRAQSTMEFLVPQHRPVFAKELLQRLVSVLTWKVMRGKQVLPEAKVDVVEKGVAKGRVVNSPFDRYMHDVRLLRDLFSGKGPHSLHAALPPADVELMVAPLLDAMLLNLANHPTVLLLAQGQHADKKPCLITYTTAQLYGMWLTCSDQNSIAHTFLTECLARRREKELEASWEEQRVRQAGEGTAGGSAYAGDDPSASGLRQMTRTATNDTAKVTEPERETPTEKKGQTSRTCSVQ